MELYLLREPEKQVANLLPLLASFKQPTFPQASQDSLWKSQGQAERVYSWPLIWLWSGWLLSQVWLVTSCWTPGGYYCSGTPWSRSWCIFLQGSLLLKFEMGSEERWLKKIRSEGERKLPLHLRPVLEQTTTPLSLFSSFLTYLHISVQNVHLGAKEMPQSAKCLLCQREDPSSGPNTHIKSCNPSTGRWRQEDSWGLLVSQPL